MSEILCICGNKKDHDIHNFNKESKHPFASKKSKHEYTPKKKTSVTDGLSEDKK